MGEVGEFFLYCFGAFHFDEVTQTLPTRTFEGALDAKVGDKLVHLKQVGPAHTRGDTIVHVPSDRTVFTGDILFIEGHPIMWAGPVGNWIDACNYINGLDVDTDRARPRTDHRQTRRHRSAQLPHLHTRRSPPTIRRRHGRLRRGAVDISLVDYDSWGDAERIVVNVATLYKEFSGDTTPNDTAALFGMMAKLHRSRRRAQKSTQKKGVAYHP